MEFKIDENLFDSGIIAPKVGTLTLENYKDLKSDDSAPIVNHARNNKYNLITLGVESPVALKNFIYLGTIYEIQANLIDVWNTVKDIPSRFYVRKLNDSDWAPIKELLNLYPPTRYSRDPNVTMEQVVVHKLKILQYLAGQYPDYSLGAFSKDNELIGFHFLKLLEDKVFLQELLVKPNSRVGFVSLQLVKENLDRVKKNTNVNYLTTRVYEDNEISMNFFTKLRFVDCKKKEHYYHMWV